MMLTLGQMPLIVGPAVTPDSCVILGTTPPTCPGGQKPICVSTPPMMDPAGYVETYPRADWVCPSSEIFGPDPRPSDATRLRYSQPDEPVAPATSDWMLPALIAAVLLGARR